MHKYNILYKGRIIALAYISPHPYLQGNCVASLAPIAISGKWTDNTMTLSFQKPLTDIFPISIENQQMIKELLALDSTEWWLCEIREVNDNE